MEWIVVPAAGISAAVAGVILMVAWQRRCQRHRRDLDALDVRIMVTGTRGKSSTIRLLHAVLAEAGLRPWGRITGTVTEELTPDSERLDIVRTGQNSVVEMFDTVRRATRGGAHSLVAECMAVNPALIELTQTAFLRAGISVITNIRADHLEDEGLDLHEIARSLAVVAEGAEVVITAEADPEVRRALAEGVGSYSAELLFVDGAALDPAVIAALDGEHPDNVAIVLAVADRLGIDVRTAIHAMQGATHEPLSRALVGHRVEEGSRTYTVAMLGAINDPQSARLALREVESEEPDAAARVAVVISRWDRPLRSLQFAGFVDPSEFDSVLLAGPLYHPMRRVLLANGWSPRAIRTLRWVDVRNVSALVRRIDAVVPHHSEVLVVNLANIDPPIIRQVLEVLEPYELSKGGER